MADISEEELQALYCWIDEIPLSRQKKNITRDFSDGVLTAEIVSHFLPQLVELHNYSPANSTAQKVENWRTLNRKVFSKLNLSIPDDLIQSAAASKPKVVEFILVNLRNKIERYLQNRAQKHDLSMHTTYPDPYTYDPHQLVTSGNGDVGYEQYDRMRHTDHTHSMPGVEQGPQQVELVQPVSETSYHRQPDYRQTDTHTKPRNIVKAPYPHTHSRLQPPSHHHHPHPSHTHTSTLPPIHAHNTSGGHVTIRGAGAGHSQLRQPLAKLPTLIQRQNTYAGMRSTRTGPSTTVQRAGSAEHKMRLAERDQKLFETQEYIQLLQMKVTRLEHLVQIKDMKIGELQRQLHLMSRNPLQRR